MLKKKAVITKSPVGISKATALLDAMVKPAAPAVAKPAYMFGVEDFARMTSGKKAAPGRAVPPKGAAAVLLDQIANSGKIRFSAPGETPGPKMSKEFMDAMGLEEARGPYRNDSRPVVAKRPMSKAERDAQFARDRATSLAQIKAAKRGRVEVALADGSSFRPDASRGGNVTGMDYSGEGQAMLDAFNATDGGRIPIGMDGNSAVGERLGGGKAAMRGLGMFVGGASRVATGLGSTGRALVGTAMQTLQPDNEAAATYASLDRKIREFEARTGKSFYKEMQKRVDSNIESSNMFIDETLGKANGPGVGPVLGFLARGLNEGIQGAGRAQVELTRPGTDPVTAGKAAFAYGQGVASLGGLVAPMAAVPGSFGKLAGGVAGVSGAADVFQPAFDLGLRSLGEVVEGAGGKVLGSAVGKVWDKGVLKHGLNRPVFDRDGGAAYDRVRNALMEAGISPETSSAYGGIADVRSRKVGSDWVPDIVRDELPKGRGNITFPEGGGRATIRLGERADATTPGHEIFHAIRRTMSAEEESAFRDHLGLDADHWDVNAEERFANAAEHFLASGDAPQGTALGSAFRHLASEFEKVTGHKPETVGDMHFAFKNLLSNGKERGGFGAHWGSEGAAAVLAQGDEPSLFGGADVPSVAEAGPGAGLDYRYWDKTLRDVEAKGGDLDGAFAGFGYSDAQRKYLLAHAGVKHVRKAEAKVTESMFEGDTLFQGDKDLEDFANEALSSPGATTAVKKLGPVSEKVSDVFRNELGKDVSDYENVVYAHSIRHAVKKHGAADEALRGQLPVSASDYGYLSEVLSNPDSVTLAGKMRGMDTVKLEKRINGHIVAVQASMDKGKRLNVETIYKRPAKESAGSTILNATEVTPGQASETFRGEPASDSITAKDTLMQPDLPKAGRVIGSEDPRLDPFSETYDPVYSDIVDRAFGTAGANGFDKGSGRSALAKLEKDVADLDGVMDDHDEMFAEEATRIMQAYETAQQNLEHYNELLSHLAPGSGVKREKLSAEDQAAKMAEVAKMRAAGLKVNLNTKVSEPTKWVGMRKNRAGNWVPLPRSPEFMSLNSGDFGNDKYVWSSIVEAVRREVESMDEGVVFVPRSTFEQLYTKGQPPKTLNGMESRGRISEILFSDVHESDIADFQDGSGQTIHAPAKAVEAAISRLRARARGAKADMRSLDLEMIAANKELGARRAKIRGEREGLVAEAYNRLVDVERRFVPESARVEGATPYSDALKEVLERAKENRKDRAWDVKPDADRMGAGVHTSTWKDKARNLLLENMTALRKADEGAYDAARGFGSSNAEANLIMKGAAEAVAQATGDPMAFRNLIPDLTSSRFVGLYDRWGNLAEQLRGMDDFDLAMAVNSGDFDPILEGIAQGSEARRIARAAMTVKPGETVKLPDGSTGVLLLFSKNDHLYTVQLRDGRRVRTEATPTPVRLDKDLAELKRLLIGTADDARQNVGLLIAGGGQRTGRFDAEIHDPVQIRGLVETERARLETVKVENAAALKAYNESFVPQIRDVHSRNNGIETQDLGPLETYVPLMPNSKGEAETSMPRGGREKLMYNRPENPRNNFATGLAEDYDVTLERLGDAVRDSVRENNKARLMDELRRSGLLVDDIPLKKDEFAEDGAFITKSPDGGVTITYPDGTEVEAEMVPINYDRYDTDEFGRPKKVASRNAAVPVWLANELRPALQSKKMDHEWAVQVLNAVNAYGMAGPADTYFHAVNVLNVLRSGAPFISKGTLGKVVEMTPVVGASTRFMTSLFRVLRTNTSDDVARAELLEMAKHGALPSRYATETFSKKYADATGAELKGFAAVPASMARAKEVLAEKGAKGVLEAGREAFGWAASGPALTGPSGLDTRARLAMWRVAKEINPNAKPAEWADFVNQLGAYNDMLASQIEREVKRRGIAPFYTAGSTMLRNGVRVWTHRTKMPLAGFGRGKKAAMWAAQQMSGGAVGALVTWAVWSKAITGKYPWDDKESQFLQIPVPNDWRNSETGKKIWGKQKGRAYVNMAFFLGMPERGARAMGIKGFYDTKALGGSTNQAFDAGARGVLNSLAHPMTSAPWVSAATTASPWGFDPYLADDRDQMGNRQAVVLHSTPDFGGGPKQWGANLAYGALDANQLVGGIVRLGTKVLNGGENVIPEQYWREEKKKKESAWATVLAYAFPRMFTPPKDLARKRESLARQQKLVDTKSRKDLTGEGGVKKSKAFDVDQFLKDMENPGGSVPNADSLLRKVGVK